MKVLILGLAAVAARQLQLWRRDMRLAERLRAERAVQMPALAAAPSISALVAAWNEGDNIAALVASFRALDYPQAELIICAGGTDDTLARARSYAGQHVIVIEQQPGEGKQAALARCLVRAGGELIYLIDADCRFDRAALDMLLTPIVVDGEDVVTGEIRPLDSQLDAILPRYLWAADVAAGARFGRYTGGLRGANTLLTRSALDASGGLGFTARTGTDYQLAQRLIAHGYQLRAVPAATVPTEYPERLTLHRKRQSRWLVNLIVHGRRYNRKQDVFLAARTVGVGAAMLLAPLAGLVFGRAALLPWLLLGAQATGAKIRYTLFAARLYRLPVPARLLAALLPLTWVDFAIWASALLDLLPWRRNRW